MTHEERAAFINAQVAMMTVELEGMKAANVHRLDCGHSIMYGEEAFEVLLQKYDAVLGHNALITFFQEP